MNGNCENTVLIPSSGVLLGGGRYNSLLINKIHIIMEKKLPYEGPLAEVVYLCVESGICVVVASAGGGGENMFPGPGGW